MAQPLSRRTVHTTALALLPPTEVWGPIQDIRRKHDRHISRWPQPHINLLYPFVPGSEFESAATVLRPVLSRISPFKIKLRCFKYFVHGKRSTTLWLNPEPDPPEALDHLQRAVTEAIPFANDLRNRFSGIFTGHISVGQFQGEHVVQVAQGNFQSKWQDIEFTVSELVFLSREGVAADCFRIEKTLALGVPEPSQSKVKDELASSEHGLSRESSSYTRGSVSGSSTAHDDQGGSVKLEMEAKSSRSTKVHSAHETVAEPFSVRPARLLTSEELAAREALAAKVLANVM